MKITTMGGRGDELQPFVRGMGEAWLDSIDEELRESTEQIRDIAEFTAPHKTGRLQDNHTTKRIKRFVYQVINITPYAYIVHEGLGRQPGPRPWLKNAHDDVTAGMLARIKMRFTRDNRKLTVEEAIEELFG